MATEIWVNIGWRHQAITWTNVDLSSVRSKDIYLEEISWEMSQPSIAKKWTWKPLNQNFVKISQGPMS